MCTGIIGRRDDRKVSFTSLWNRTARMLPSRAHYTLRTEQGYSQCTFRGVKKDPTTIQGCQARHGGKSILNSARRMPAPAAVILFQSGGCAEFEMAVRQCTRGCCERPGQSHHSCDCDCGLEEKGGSRQARRSCHRLPQRRLPLLLLFSKSRPSCQACAFAPASKKRRQRQPLSSKAYRYAHAPFSCSCRCCADCDMLSMHSLLRQVMFRQRRGGGKSAQGPQD
jgi:hypothetical protein